VYTPLYKSGNIVFYDRVLVLKRWP